MLRTTESLTNTTELDVFTSREVMFQPQAACTFVVEGSVASTGNVWNPVPVDILSDGVDAQGNGGPVAANTIIRVNTQGLSRLRFPQLASSTTTSVTRVVPFEIARQPQSLVTLGGLGDSQLASGITTVAGPDAQNLATGRLGVLTSHNVLMWASGKSRGRLVYAGVAGEGGVTSSMIVASHLPTAINRRWTFCAISATTNDVAASVPAATTIANIEYMVVSLLAVGTIPIIMGNLPNRLTTGAAYDALNIGLRNLANKYARYGVLYEDAWTPFVGTDGLGISGSFRDNTHLTHAANLTRGSNLADLILAAHPWTPTGYLPVSNAAGKSGLFTNPIFTANSGAVTPTGWAISGTGVTSNVASGAVGNDWTLTRGSANSVGNTSSAIAVAGGTYVWYGGVTTTGTANTSTQFGFRDPAFVGANHAWVFQINSAEVPANYWFAVLFAVPTGFPDNHFRFTSAGSVGSTFVWRQLELYTTTAWA